MARSQVVFGADSGGGSGGGADGGQGAPAPAGGAGAGGGAAGGSGGGAGGGAPPPVAFAETLPEAYRNEAAFRDIRSLDDLAKSYVNQGKMLGKIGDPKSLVAVPAEGDANGWNEVFTRLGRPEKADGYQLTKLPLPEGTQIDEGFQKDFLTKAHEAGLSNKQADALVQWWSGKTASVLDSQTQAGEQRRASAEQTLKTDWGQAFDQKLGDAKAAIGHYARELKLGDDVATALERSGLGNEPALAKLFAHLGGQLREDGLVGKDGGGSGAGAAYSPAEARQQIAGLQGDKSFMAAYTDKRAPGHADAVAKMQRLYEAAYPAS